MISVVVIFVLSMAAGFVVHGVLLGAEYAKLPNLLRQPDDSSGYFGYMLFAHLH